MNTAFLFPGQGSQSVGMMKELAGQSEIVTATFAEASEALGYDLWQVVQEGPEDRLNQTETTQPAMLAADVATFRVYRAEGGAIPGHLAGHSLGEYAALVAAESLDFADAVRLVAERGRQMQQAVPAGEGAMAAILGLEDAVLEDLCKQQAGEEVVSCANLNAPGQVVVAGNTAAVQRVCEAALDAGARRALPLPVSVPSHCALMKPAAEKLAAVLAEAEIRTPVVPVLHNADVQSYNHADEIREALARQLWQPVQWTRSIQHLVTLGIDQFAECGPGKVLAGLNRRIDRGAATTALTDLESIQELIGSKET